MSWKKGERKAINIEFKSACREIFDLLKQNELSSIVLKPVSNRPNRIAANHRRIYSIYPDMDIFLRNGDLVEGEYTIAKQNKNGKVRKRLFMSPEEQISFIHLYETNLYQQLVDSVSDNSEGAIGMRRK